MNFLADNVQLNRIARRQLGDQVHAATALADPFAIDVSNNITG